jgi:hypothetical protein
MPVPTPIYNCPFSASTPGANATTCGEHRAASGGGGCPLYDDNRDDCLLALALHDLTRTPAPVAVVQTPTAPRWRLPAWLTRGR